MIAIQLLFLFIYLNIHLIHRCEIPWQVGEVDVGFDDVLEARTRCYEDFLQVLERGALQ
jgi:hypothetical protein